MIINSYILVKKSRIIFWKNINVHICAYYEERNIKDR